MITPPSEISVINLHGRILRATCTGLFNIANHTHQYRIKLPGVEVSLVVIEVTEPELLNYIKSAKPIRIKPKGE